jgi:hypothetical protein
MCGTEFEASRSSATYCSKKCSMKAYQLKNKHVLICQRCGTEFKHYDKRFKYCSKKCNTILKEIKKCLYCNKEFEVTASRKSFCSKKCYSDSKRTNVICQYCGEEFSTYNREDKKQKYCSRKCYDNNRKAFSKIKNCLKCGKEFKVTTRTKNHVFCSHICSGKNYLNRGSENVICEKCGKEFKKSLSKIKNSKTHYCQNCRTGKKEFIGFTNVECANCKTEFKKSLNSMTNKTGKYCCSQKCASEYFKGKNSPIWKHGDNQPKRSSKYPGYLKWVEGVYKRDNFTCVICNDNKKVYAHHILPVKQYPEKATILTNGLTLCKPCHMFAHHCLTEKVYTKEELLKFKDQFLEAKKLWELGDRKKFKKAWDEVKCEQCDIKFYKRHSELRSTNKNFCSRKCSNINCKESRHKVICKKCGSVVLVSPSKFKRNKTFSCVGGCHR